ncbi:3'-5' exonuclease [Gluconobacter sp. NFX36]|uniref:3'-5' exonuclease n=1 Tax=Gluconobacter sp. NFX36 TaxID=2819535 RepID=UPI003CEF0BAF
MASSPIEATLPPEENNTQHLQVKNTSKTLKFFKCPIFLDIETTGLHSDDRIVSLSIVRCLLNDEKPTVEVMNLVFDPLKKSHPMAEKVHQLDDWMLRHQDVFGQHISEISEMLESGDCLVAHNANFDISFLEREFERWGQPMPQKPVFCTMVEAQQQGWRPANLSACISRIGMQRQSSQHLAVEDALMCMGLWWHWLGIGAVQSDPQSWPKFSNLRPFPTRPNTLPRRDNKKKLATFYQTPPEEE